MKTFGVIIFGSIEVKNKENFEYFTSIGLCQMLENTISYSWRNLVVKHAKKNYFWQNIITWGGSLQYDVNVYRN